MIDYPLNPDHLVDPDFHSSVDLHRLWTWMRKNEPVYWHKPSYLPSFWSITRYNDIKDIYSNPKIFSSAKGVLLRPSEYNDDPGGGLTLALTDPPRHRQLRTIMVKWFSLNYVKSLEAVIKLKASDLIDKAIQHGKCNFTVDISSRLTLFMTCYILGIPEKKHEDIFHWTHESFKQGKSLAAHRELMSYFCDLMDQKKSNPSNDLASSIVNGIIDNKPLDEKEIILNFENLIGATENAGLSISTGILTLIKKKESWKNLYNNRKLIAPAIEEILRWASSASHSMRTVTETVVINNNKFNVGDRVVLWLPSANRDDSIFDQPFKFDITRTPNPHIALGYGEHFCIGNALGRIQMRSILNKLLDSGLEFDLYDEPKFLRSIYVNGPEFLPVKFNKI